MSIRKRLGRKALTASGLFSNNPFLDHSPVKVFGIGNRRIISAVSLDLRHAPPPILSNQPLKQGPEVVEIFDNVLFLLPAFIV